jgi:hypothetical protein
MEGWEGFAIAVVIVLLVMVAFYLITRAVQ